MPANRGDYMTLTPDDFLNEVVAEMRRIVKEGDDLRDQLNECRQTKGMPAVAKADPNAAATKAADAKAAEEAEAKANREAQDRLAAIAAKADEAEKAAQARIAAAQAKAEEAEKTAQARA